MKKFIGITLVSSLALVAGLSSTVKAADDFSAVYFVHGTLGDKSFMDSAQRGMEMAKEKLNMRSRTVEAGLDSTQWEPAFRDVVEFEDYDVYVAVTYPMASVVQELAQEYPDKKFVLIDAEVDYSACSNKCDNVYSLLFKQSEASLLAGAYAASMTKSEAPQANKDKMVVGIVGGQEVPVIQDFVVGFEQGVEFVDKDVKVLVQYANSWTDPAKGKEIAKALYDQGADIVFAVAGGTGQGVFEAAQEENRYAIGVDADQSEILKASNPTQASLIITSVLKNVDTGLLLVLEKAKKGELNYGQSEFIGVKEGAVGLAKNEVYKSVTPYPVQENIKSIELKLINKSLVANSVFNR
ncbi:BMP family ABC transporter substrate-binding protein [Vibrio pomeroyi]|uniref:BMP family ABC transporter substrate-binding protein n=1 Tax=Vibrio TaxID=662 RepID=UPI0035A6E74B